MNSNPIYAVNYFYINPTSGALSVTRMLAEDESRPVRYTLSILASDNGLPKQFAVTEVVVSVVRNRNRPKFTKNVYEMNIDENIDVGSSLLQVSATDIDGVRIYQNISPLMMNI